MSRRSIVFVLLILVGFYGGAIAISISFVPEEEGFGPVIAAYFAAASVGSLLSAGLLAFDRFRPAWILCAGISVFGIATVFLGGFCLTFVPFVMTAAAAVMLRTFDLDRRMYDIASNADEMQGPGEPTHVDRGDRS